MTKDDDLEAYIEAFEQHALATGLDKRYWASQLGALVVGKAQAAYWALSRDDALDYEHVKEAILARDAKVAHKKIQNREGWLGEIEESEGSADEMDAVDLSDLTSSFLFREAQEEDPDIGAFQGQAQEQFLLGCVFEMQANTQDFALLLLFPSTSSLLKQGTVWSWGEYKLTEEKAAVEK
ncbi:hypothetical protein Y1Q_0022533 [Alligator mississippiensis]|uniref:Uncharacterized protein n=1 Tax=Alligator mississippiensis TaxID=8496 RepID=A0A151NW39_ALLMI|nr:hypothetical protein Y1Q_0022533 [Alligator mississippiensis]